MLVATGIKTQNGFLRHCMTFGRKPQFRACLGQTFAVLPLSVDHLWVAVVKKSRLEFCLHCRAVVKAAVRRHMKYLPPPTSSVLC